MQSSFIPVVALIAILLLVHSEQVPQSGDGAELKVKKKTENHLWLHQSPVQYHVSLRGSR